MAVQGAVSRHGAVRRSSAHDARGGTYLAQKFTMIPTEEPAYIISKVHQY